MKPDEFKAILERGTPGPWRAYAWNLDSHFKHRIYGARNEYVTDDYLTEADAHKIVTSVNLAPLLVELWNATIAYDNARSKVEMWDADLKRSEVLAALAAFKGES